MVKERAKEAQAQLAKGAVEAGKVVDETITNTKYLFGSMSLNPVPAYAGGVSKQTTNTHYFENKIKDTLSKIEGVNIGGKGTGNTSRIVNEANLNNIDEFINGTNKFDDVIDDYVKLYSEKIILNKTWSWNKSLHG